MKIKKVTIHFWIEKSTSYLFKRYLNWNERLSIVKAVRYCSNWKHSKIDLPSCRREFFNKILCTKRRYIWCDTWCSSSNRSWWTKSNDKSKTWLIYKVSQTETLNGFLCTRSPNKICTTSFSNVKTCTRNCIPIAWYLQHLWRVCEFCYYWTQRNVGWFGNSVWKS